MLFQKWDSICCFKKSFYIMLSIVIEVISEELIAYLNIMITFAQTNDIIEKETIKP